MGPAAPQMPLLGEHMMQTPAHPMQYTPRPPMVEGNAPATATSDHMMFTSEQLPINDFSRGPISQPPPVVNGKGFLSILTSCVCHR